MSSDTQTLTFTQSIKGSPKQVFYAFTRASALNEWLCDFSTVIPDLGGRIYLWWNSGFFSSGEFTEVEANKRLAFTWHGREDLGDTKLIVTFTDKNGATLLKLDHSGFGTGDVWAKSIKECQAGWEKGMENLVSIFETGEDLRHVRRPMLGILINEFNEDIAKKLSVPVDKGIRIDDPVEGMGAEAAGLQSDDVIVALGGHATRDFPELAEAIQPYHAGDEVEVVFYRGSEKKLVMMELSRRPFPEIPEKTKDLAKAVEDGYAKQHEQLANFLEDVTEEEATFKPSNDAWSIMETLAHLVQAERGRIIWISGVIVGYQAHYDDYGGNLPIYNQATLAAYPTVAELQDHLKRLGKETVALVNGLPDDLPIYKNIYWRLGNNLLESPYHFDAHLDQMKAVLEESRK